MTKVSQENSLDIDLVRAALDADYEILEELGRGGMAVVYRARERALDREVAIKVLPSFMSMDTAFVERFQHEARTAGHLEHPGIVPIYRVGTEGKVIYFVMKLLRGQSVATVLRERYKLGVPEIRRILIETTSALGYAAKRGVVHRDIKPDNILLDDEGRCVLTDFGIAKSSGGPNTAAGTSMGTPRYMSPEHARGITLDGRSDMYSLGVVAYQCLTGATPFDADDPFAVLYKHINDPIPEPVLETEEERELYAIIKKMLAKQPQDRYQNADELIAALGGTAASSAPTLIRTATPSKPARMSGLSATEIIESPTLRTQLRNLSRDRRLWAGAGVLMLFLAMTFVSRPGIGTTDSADGLPAPGGAVGATTKAVGATTTVAGATIGPRPDSARLASSGAAGASTKAKAPPAATKTTTTKTANRTDSGRPAGSSLSRVGSAPAAVRSTRDASKCPRTIPPGVLALLVDADSLPPQPLNARTIVAYDVCGLTEGASFTTTLKFRKLNQRGFGRQPDKTFTFPNVASGPRLRLSHPVDLSGLSKGDYALDIIILDQLARDRGKTVFFRIDDK